MTSIQKIKDQKIKNNHKPHKPDSVPIPSFIWPQHYCCDLAAYPGTLPTLLLESDEPPSMIPIHGITAPKVYPLLLLPVKTVSSYLTFSPLSPQYCGDGYFLWHFLAPTLLWGAGYSPVGCPLLSGLSSPILSERWFGLMEGQR